MTIDGNKTTAIESTPGPAMLCDGHKWHAILGRCLYCGGMVLDSNAYFALWFGASAGYVYCHNCRELHHTVQVDWGRPFRPDPYEWQPFSVWLENVGAGFSEEFLARKMEWLRAAWSHGNVWVEFHLTKAWLDWQILRGIRGY